MSSSRGVTGAVTPVFVSLLLLAACDGPPSSSEDSLAGDRESLVASFHGEYDGLIDVLRSAVTADRATAMDAYRQAEPYRDVANDVEFIRLVQQLQQRIAELNAEEIERLYSLIQRRERYPLERHQAFTIYEAYKELAELDPANADQHAARARTFDLARPSINEQFRSSDGGHRALETVIRSSKWGADGYRHIETKRQLLENGHLFVTTKFLPNGQDLPMLFKAEVSPENGQILQVHTVGWSTSINDLN